MPTQRKRPAGNNIRRSTEQRPARTGAEGRTGGSIVRSSKISLKNDLSPFCNEADKKALGNFQAGESLQVMRRATYVLTAILCAGSLHAQNAVSDPQATQALQARATIANGQVTRLRDDQPWAISTGDQVPVQQTVSTGQDGYAQMKLEGGTSFEIFSNSKVMFRQNAGNPNDVMDLLAGRVRVQLRPKRGEQQRIFSPSAIISTHLPTSLALAVDEDDTVRIDVIEGEIRVQHTRLPGNEAVLVRAIDSILVQKNEAISRRVDRGTLYRYRARIMTAITFGHSGHDGEPIEGNKFLPGGHAAHALRLCF